MPIDYIVPGTTNGNEAADIINEAIDELNGVVIKSISDGDGIGVDDTDPQNPIVFQDPDKPLSLNNAVPLNFPDGANIEGANGGSIIINSTASIAVQHNSNDVIVVDQDGAHINEITYPATDGTAGQVITTDGSGNLEFSSLPSEGITVTDDTTTVDPV